ncbi:ER-associated proteolytic system protein-like protein Der1 [Bisporella sp. PMI_857]|nr:ER-associated proteolytic system protein-like protein Der1 [Bisporella sp. PMI_857]
MSAMDVFWQAPPISRTLAAATLTMSILVYTGTLSFYYVLFAPSLMLKLPPQLWRLFTSFLLTSKDLGIIFDTYFLYTYGSKLETASPRFTQPGDFFAYLLFVCFTIVGLNALVTGGMIFSGALVLALAYTSCQDDRGGQATLFVIRIPAQWMPYAMLLITFVMAGPDAAKVQATGLIASHLHDFLTRLWPAFGGGRNLLPTPTFIRRLFETTQASVSNRSFGTAFAPAQRAPASGSTSEGVLPESWRNRGTGHRLGGD